MTDQEYVFVYGDVRRNINYNDGNLEKTISCPKIKSFGVQVPHMTVSKEQCLVRIKNNSRCAKNCEVAKHLTEELEQDSI